MRNFILLGVFCVGVFTFTLAHYKTTKVDIPVVQPDFNSIWSRGYIDGWCYEQESCIEPIVPIPPLPRIKDTTYTIIYNRGFLTGLKTYRHGRN